ELVERETEPLGDEILDPLDRDLGGLALREYVTQDVLGELDRHRPAGERRERHDARERTLELADVRRDAARDEGQNLLVVDVDPVDLHLAAEDRDASLEIRRLDVGDQAPLEPAAEPLLERRDVARRAIRREHDLRAGFVEGVERMEELLLEALLPLEEL